MSFVIAPPPLTSGCFHDRYQDKQVRCPRCEPDEQPVAGHIVAVAEVAATPDAIVELPCHSGEVVPWHVDPRGRCVVAVIDDDDRTSVAVAPRPAEQLF